MTGSINDYDRKVLNKICGSCQNLIWMIQVSLSCHKTISLAIFFYSYLGHMIFGLEQESGRLIAPMALAHPLHPIDNRSRNKRRNLWVGRCVSSWWPWFPSRCYVLMYMYIYMYVHSLYEFCYRSYIQRECHSVLAKLHPITFYRIISGECAVPGLNATFCFIWFTNCVLLFDKNLILGCLWPLVFVLNNILLPGI